VASAAGGVGAVVGSISGAKASQRTVPAGRDLAFVNQIRLGQDVRSQSRRKSKLEEGRRDAKKQR